MEAAALSPRPPASPALGRLRSPGCKPERGPPRAAARPSHQACLLLPTFQHLLAVAVLSHSSFIAASCGVVQWGLWPSHPEAKVPELSSEGTGRLPLLASPSRPTGASPISQHARGPVSSVLAVARLVLQSSPCRSASRVQPLSRQPSLVCPLPHVFFLQTGLKDPGDPDTWTLSPALTAPSPL